MTFRDAGEGDLAFLLDGLADNRAIEGHPSPSITDADRAQYAARIDAGTVRMLEVDEEAAAFLSYELDREILYVPPPFLWIDLVYVRPSRRGRGLGRVLYEEAARIARARGATRVVADVFEENAGSRAFHERVGFRPLYTILAREL